MQSVIEKLLDNLIVAALIPCVVFFTIAALIFAPIVPFPMVESLKAIFGNSPTFIVAAAICASFALSYLIETIYSFYRGMFLSRFKIFSRYECSQLSKLATKIQNTKNEINKLKQSNPEDPKLRIENNKLKDFLVEREINFPPDENIILPSRFGNILASAEAYPAYRYGMDAVHLWPRLQHLLPQENFDKVNQVNHEMALLINSSMLNLWLAVFCGLALLVQILVLFYDWTTSIIPILPANTIFPSYPFGLIIYFAGVPFFIAASWFFYRLSLPIALRYGTMYKAAFDLFRFKLFEQLRFNCPENREQEMQQWAVLCEFLTVGDIAGDLPIKLGYNHSNNNHASDVE
jgi:hypothetical protein